MKRILTNLLATFGALTIAYLFLSTFSPFTFFEWKYSEDERKASPDGRFEAVLLRGNAGATSGYQFEIYVVEKGKEIDRELDWARRVYESYENSGLFTYEWKEKDLYVTVEETPINGFWPYYFSQSEDKYQTRTKEGNVYLIFKREKNS